MGDVFQTLVFFFGLACIAFAFMAGMIWFVSWIDSKYWRERDG